MQVEELVEGLGQSGLEVAYRQYEEGDVPQLPYLVYYFDSSADMYADDTNYINKNQLYVELYTNNKDFDTEASVEEALKNLGLTYEKEQQYISSERMYEVLYIMEVIING